MIGDTQLRVQFFDTEGNYISACVSAIVPRQGEYMCIADEAFRVMTVAWTLCSPPSSSLKYLMAIVVLERDINAKNWPIDFKVMGINFKSSEKDWVTQKEPDQWRRRSCP
ncbi:hypothetical protein IWQ48_003787 [Labrenzia sp. EL_13]|nr:hypothetical protein [Labrenzia sp. EL_13]